MLVQQKPSPASVDPKDIDTLHSFFQPQQRSVRSERTPSSGRPLTPGSMVGTPRAVFDDKVARMGLGFHGVAGAQKWGTNEEAQSWLFYVVLDILGIHFGCQPFLTRHISSKVCLLK